MTLQDRLASCHDSRKALLAANFYNFETLKALLLAAREEKSEIILQLSEASLHYLGILPAINMARTLLTEFDVQGWIHLDHGSDPEMIGRCLEAGFDSVMIDASEKSFEDNVRITSAIVKMAEAYGANVEAELGYVAKLGQDQRFDYTDPADAKKFVEETGVHALAVAVGSAHGFYKSPPDLQIDLLRKIREETDAALVLHGSSGIDAPQLKAAIQNGICKINLATETKNTFMKALRRILSETDQIDLRVVFPEAMEEVKQLIIHKLRIINSD